MISIQGKWFDGQTSAQIDAVLSVYDSGAWHVVRADNGEMMRRQSKFSPKISPRLANTPRYITFSQGESFETVDNQGVDHILAQLGKKGGLSWVHLLESKMRYIIPVVAIFILLAIAAVKYGVPAAAKTIAAHLPPAVFQKAGEQTLRTLDRIIFKPSELDSDIEQRLRNHLQAILDDHRGQKIELLFRKGGAIGPNAFALPGGQIVFTDEMIEISESDDEILAVLAHEIGHVVHQHGMRRLVQDSLLSFAVLALTGDASGVSELFLGLPVVMTELAYSRDFEREADQFAINYLNRRNKPLHPFADILTRISKIEKEKAKNTKGDSKWTGYLSTHPSTRERIESFDGSHKAP